MILEPLNLLFRTIIEHLQWPYPGIINNQIITLIITVCIDEPEISIIVANGGVRGECTRLIADVTPTDLFGWSLKWQRVKNLKTEKIDINREKFRGSNERQLVIHSMCEEDGGNYQAVLTRDTGGKYQIISSTVCLPITEGKLNSTEIATFIFLSLYNCCESSQF